MLDVYDLRCEYAANPLGIGASIARLGWKLSHTERNQRQSAYQVIAAAAAAALLAGRREGLLWDSGKVGSSESVAVEWGGAPLGSRQRVYWRVRCWDAQDRPSGWSETAWFETALLHADDWQATWIGCPAAWPGRAINLRRAFVVDRPVARARLYVAGLGYCESFVNGTRLGDAVLDPAHTDTSKRVMYRTFDVADHLQAGENVLGFALGNGWHGQTRLLAQLEMRDSDGNLVTICTGPQGGWLAAPSATIENSVYGGETYDARAETPGWNLPHWGKAVGEARPAGWLAAMAVPPPGGVLTAQTVEPIKRMAELQAQRISAPRPGVYVVDLGQNIAGWARLRVRGEESERGRRITLRFAESLYEDGAVNQENLRAAKATDAYILRGEGEEVWEPRFTYHGFRYVQVEGYPGTLPDDAITGIVVRSAVADAGAFSCSNDLLNRIHSMVRWTEQDNLHGIPTDCPQRDERMGWLNDMTARAEEAIMNFDLARLLAKWIGDIYDAQDHNSGAIPGTAPWGWSPRPACPVCVSYLETAWLLYAHYGDARTIAAYYDGFKQWLDCLTSMAQDGIVRHHLWGDWAPPIDVTVPGSARNATAPPEIMSTGFYYYTAHLLGRIAGILGKSDDQARYSDLAASIDAAFNRNFWNEQTGGYGPNSQSCNAFALWLGLVPPGRQGRVVANLVRDVIDLRGTHLTTGNVGTKYLLEALTAHGRADVALALAAQSSYPSWGYMLANGATTLWERWELYTGGGMNSHNHPMLGSVGYWFYKALAGINLAPGAAGCDRLRIEPRFVAGLDDADGEYQSVRGVVRCSWQRTAGLVHLSLDIPVNAEADVVIPIDGSTRRVLEGDTPVWDQHGPTGHPDVRVTAQDGETLTMHVGSGHFDLRIVSSSVTRSAAS